MSKTLDGVVEKNRRLKAASDREAELRSRVAEFKAELEVKTTEMESRLLVKDGELEALRGELENVKAELDAVKLTASEMGKRVPQGFNNVVNALESSLPALRREAARAFMKSRTYLELLAKQTNEDQEDAMKVIIGQLKNKKHLPVEFDAEDVISLGLDENFKEPTFDAVADDRVLQDDEFFGLYEFDPSSAVEDSFRQEVTRVSETARAEMYWVATGSTKQWERKKNTGADSSDPDTPPPPT
jgi:hypothetical protein